MENWLKKGFFTVVSATALSLGLAAEEAQALGVYTLSDTITQSGDTLQYDFQGLPQALPGTELYMRLFTNTTPLSGIDIDGNWEYFDLSLDGVMVGRFSCADPLPSNTAPNFMMDCLPESFNNHQIFNHQLALSELGLNLASLVGDGELQAELAFSSGVNWNSSSGVDEVHMEIKYMEQTPEPSLIIGFITFGGFLLGSRKKTKS
ncbi:MAG: PEP-CTERM sorting domain-containing protein [Okeania sp. SIO3I5]|uniref:PEP-CTERM sorting domain-containing protein n=1 Tax=Okeania sp. SIO3I5 TaxID=2607805 RepID=UPI0013BDC2AC|nr:PEP-CTERM sorting domain-containing protein [Okeania sp. SIO3I5]NEQ39422.1 PEP-CTERM sorting domain-containing protein [Okeania sp. SIO3I5]